MTSPIPSDSSPCPCGRQAAFAACCAPFLRRQVLPPTAESLMRSRYVAYVCRDADYLLSTWAPTTRPRSLNLTSDRSEWLGLQMLDVVAGGPQDVEGQVEFVARYRSQGQTASLHERSRFMRVDGAWLYVDGDLRPSRPEPTQPVVRAAAPGRNDPCPCGSGQKYKRCCGR